MWPVKGLIKVCIETELIWHHHMRLWEGDVFLKAILAELDWRVNRCSVCSCEKPVELFFGSQYYKVPWGAPLRIGIFCWELLYNRPLFAGLVPIKLLVLPWRRKVFIIST